jgi:RNA polymerase sigma factor (sigma-70 family)
MKTFTDEEIVQGLRQKNPRVTEDITEFLYKECQATVTRMVRNNSGGYAEANDLFQEVILAFLNNVWEGKYELRANTKVKTYFLEIAKLMWLRQLRTNENRRRREDDFRQEKEESVSIDSNSDAENSEEVAHAWRVFNRLEERCRAILTAFYLEKKSLQEIAEEFGYSSAEYAKTVKFRCLLRLKQLIHQ